MSALTESLVDRDRLARGQEHFAGVTQQLVGYLDPALAARLPVGDSSPYLEPLLFTFLTHDSVVLPLEQVLLGYLPEDGRRDRIRVVPDGDGVVYLPAIGSARVACSDPSLTLEWRRSLTDSVFRESATVVPHVVSPISRLCSTGIELTETIDPLTAVLFSDDGGSLPTRSQPSAEETSPLAVALTALEDHLHYLFEAIQTAVRRITVFRATRPNSFASPRAHGAVFLNTEPDADEVFFVEDLAHQGGHVIFSSLTWDRDRWFLTQPDTPLSNFTGDTTDGRTVYVTLHGLFTEALMTQALAALHAYGSLPPRQQHELLGRVAFILLRFRSELANLAYDGLLSRHGQELYDRCCAVYEEATDRYGEVVQGYDLSNQPYTFSARRFLAANPGPDDLAVAS